MLVADGSDSDDSDDDGRILIEFDASNNCGAVSVSAVIELGCHDDDDDGGAAEVAVVSGQTIEVECDDEDCEVEFDEGILEIEATNASLVVTATDECGNEATCTVELCVSVTP